MAHADIKKSIEAARAFLHDVMDDVKEIRFEGVEMHPDVNDGWSLTFSIFRSPIAGGKNLGIIETSRLDKSFYKVVVDRNLEIHSILPA